MSEKRKKGPQLGGVTLQSIKSELTKERVRLRDLKPEIKLTNRVLDDSHVNNAVLAWFLTQEPAKRERIVRDGVKLYHERVASVQTRTADGLGVRGKITPKLS